MRGDSLDLIRGSRNSFATSGTRTQTSNIARQSSRPKSSRHSIAKV
jgi:hypothetical protein